VPEYCAIFSLCWHLIGSSQGVGLLFLGKKNAGAHGKYGMRETRLNSYSVAEIMKYFLFVINGNLIVYFGFTVMNFGYGCHQTQ
jgi:hypothetical protein